MIIIGFDNKNFTTKGDKTMKTKFSLFWFVIKKKTFADLIALFKKK